MSIESFHVVCDIIHHGQVERVEGLGSIEGEGEQIMMGLVVNEGLALADVLTYCM